jgi:hypothetical protein
MLHPVQTWPILNSILKALSSFRPSQTIQ